MIGLHWERVESVSNSGGCEDEDTLTHTDTYTLDKNNKENKNNNNIAAPFSNLRLDFTLIHTKLKIFCFVARTLLFITFHTYIQYIHTYIHTAHTL